MNTYFDNFLEKLAASLPSILTTIDLVNTGLFKNQGVLAKMRQKGTGPAYLKIGEQIKYLKEDFIAWIRESYMPQKKKAKKQETDDGQRTFEFEPK